MPRIMVVLVLLFLSCRTAAPTGVPAASSNHEYDLKVAIYPVANADTIAKRLKTEFEAAYPAYTVTVTVADSTPLYNADSLSQWLIDGTYDLVEADMILLETVLRKVTLADKSLPVWTSPPHLEDWEPSMRAASSFENDIYGVPHYGCGFFLFTTDVALSQIHDNKLFIEALQQVADKKKYLVAMNLDGTVTTGAVYLNAWSTVYGNLAEALKPPYNDDRVIAAMKRIAGACRPSQTGTDIPCLSGAFKNNADRQAYVAGEANVFIGYSEALHDIRKANPARIYVVQAPLGGGDQPRLYADSLLRRVGCTEDTPCGAATQAFAEYYLRSATYEWLLLGQDIPDNLIPRYLIPATKSGWPSSDDYYVDIQHASQSLRAFPNAVYYGIRTTMRDEIKPLIQP